MGRRLDDSKDRFDQYRKWFRTLLIKEFLNLPFKEQNKFIAIVEKFIIDCKKTHAEAENIKEQFVHLTVESTEGGILTGKIVETGDLIRIDFPPTARVSIGDILELTVFSMDGETWYSSKQELITGRNLS